MSRAAFPFVVACIAALGVASATAAPNSAASRRDESAPVVFTDPTGDAGTAADIKTVLVSNDANNQVTFQINFASGATSTDATNVWINSDGTWYTGDTSRAGADWDLYYRWSDHTWEVATWDGPTLPPSMRWVKTSVIS